MIDEICEEASRRSEGLSEDTRRVSESLVEVLNSITKSQGLPLDLVPDLVPVLRTVSAPRRQPEEASVPVTPEMRLPPVIEPKAKPEALPPELERSVTALSVQVSSPVDRPTVSLEPAAYAIEGSHIEPLAKSAINNPPESPALGPNEVYFPPGQLLFSKGDSADNFYVIRRGDVSLFEPISQKEIAVLPAGTSFGEQAILVGGVRSVSARSVDGVICLALSATTLRDMLEIQEGSIKPVVEALLLQLYLRNDLQARGHAYTA